MVQGHWNIDGQPCELHREEWEIQDALSHIQYCMTSLKKQ